MRLTNHATVLNFSGRRKAGNELQEFFEIHQRTPVRFKDENGELQSGLLIDYFLDEGVFVIRTRDGQQHEVNPDQMMEEVI